MHPRSERDFLTLYQALQQWHEVETTKIKHAYPIRDDPERKEKFQELLLQETRFLQDIDRLHMVASEENRKDSIQRLLIRMSDPRQWHGSDGRGNVHMDTRPNQRARQLMRLYNALIESETTDETRLELLLNVRYTIEEYAQTTNYAAPKELLVLIEREKDLISRARRPELMQGLRQRIASLFLEFIKIPDFNPEAAKHSKLPYIRDTYLQNQRIQPKDGGITFSTTRTVKVDYRFCPSCAQYKNSASFLSSRHCQECDLTSNIAVRRSNEREIDGMADWMATDEMHKTKRLSKIYAQLKQAILAATDYPNEQSRQKALEMVDTTFAHHCVSIPLTQLSTKQLRYLCEVVWKGQSAISRFHRPTEGQKLSNAVGIPFVQGSEQNRFIDYGQLMMTRWDPLQPLTPWNCILLDKSEVKSHDHHTLALFLKQLKENLELIRSKSCSNEDLESIPGAIGPAQLYSPSFVLAVQSKHVMARQRFNE
jgi:hypothetical protein